MAVSIRQVAETAGVSTATVSHVLGRRGHSYRPETCQRVLRVAREMGYRPNASARSMRSGRFGAVALLLSTEPHRSSLPGTLLGAIQDVLAKQDLHLTLGRLPDERLTSEGFVPKILRELMADGLLINYFADVPQRLVELIQSYHLPSVWLNVKQRYDAVCPDDIKAARQAVQRLATLGHRRIAYVNYSRPAPGNGPHYSMLDRRRGYERAMRQAGLSAQVIEPEAHTERAARVEASISWLTGEDRPTAVIGYGASSALPVLYAAAVGGLRVPQDLSLVTFSDQLVDEAGMPLDTILVPEQGVAEAAVEMLMQKINDPSQQVTSRKVAFGFERGRSVGPPAHP